MRISRLIDLFTSQLARHLTLVFSGNIFAAGLAFLSIIFISRHLSVSDFGFFSIALSFMIISPHFASFGMDTSLIKFASSYLGRDQKDEASEVVRITLRVRLITSFSFAAVLFAGSNILARKIFHYPELVPLFRLAAFGAFSSSLFNYVKSVFYTYKMFKNYVALQILVDLFKLLSVWALVLFRIMTVHYAVAVFAFLPFMGILLGFWKIKHIVFVKTNPVQRLLSQLLHYSKWVFVATLFKQAFPWIGLYMLARMIGSEAAGIYGLAINLNQIFPILFLSLWSVLMPEVSRFREIEQFNEYIKKSLKISLSLAVLVIPILFFSDKIIFIFFGPRYLESAVIFNWLLLSYVFITINATMRSALYSMHIPHIVAFADVARVAAMVLGCYLFIPILDILAPAILSLILNVSVLGFLAIYGLRYIHKRKGGFQKEDVPDPFFS